ncbi:RPAP1-like protein [Scheffersomyces xylosifermentans]|uniref:RPAP1-like protein n=1 Tax=Scheffersomyces xylosifermentans TaxID=1304137 RepID=UPI00315CE454
MDFIGEIVEHDTQVPVAPTPMTTGGFPDVVKLRQKKASRWKQRIQKEGKDSASKPLREQPEPVQKELSEAEKIHKENMDKISQMTEEEITKEREELLQGLDPKLIQSLLKRTEKRLNNSEKKDNSVDITNHSHETTHDSHDHDHNHDHHEHAEGYNGWIGGIRTKDGLSDLSQLDEEDVNKALGINGLSLVDDIQESEHTHKDSSKPKKSVTFNNEVATVNYAELDETIKIDPNGWEDVDDINDLIPNMPQNTNDEIAPDDYQLLQEEDENKLDVHFVKPKSNSDDLDINDPDFYEKLHEKYYPDLPKETEKLSWMTKPLPKQVSTTYESIADMRFDFKGDLIELQNEADPRADHNKEIPTYIGLHHHSDNAHLAGYTLSELAHLCRSVVPGQRCVSIQTLGRILHKLGLHKYSILPIDDNKPEDEYFNENLRELVNNFEKMMWDLIDELRIIESITEASDESKTRNLSVRNYAIEALWLWKKGGGRPEVEEQTEEDIITKAVQQ